MRLIDHLTAEESNELKTQILHIYNSALTTISSSERNITSLILRLKIDFEHVLKGTASDPTLIKSLITHIKAYYKQRYPFEFQQILQRSNAVFLRIRGCLASRFLIEWLSDSEEIDHD